MTKISEDNDGKALALCCYEYVHMWAWCHRILFSHWWMYKANIKLQELTGQGELIELEDLPKNTKPGAMPRDYKL